MGASGYPVECAASPGAFTTATATCWVLFLGSSLLLLSQALTCGAASRRTGEALELIILLIEEELRNCGHSAPVSVSSRTSASPYSALFMLNQITLGWLLPSLPPPAVSFVCLFWCSQALVYLLVTTRCFQSPPWGKPFLAHLWGLHLLGAGAESWGLSLCIPSCFYFSLSSSDFLLASKYKRPTCLQPGALGT